MPTIDSLLMQAQLPGDSAELDAQILLAHCLGKDRSYLYAWPEREPQPLEVEQYLRLLEARRRGEPIAYLVGRRDFWTFSLQVDQRCLIPRPETETLVEWALQLDLPANARVSDWGTGSGAIALALATERPRWSVLAIDRDDSVLELATDNAAELGLGNVGFLRSEWGSGLSGQCFHLLVSNPPYVAAADEHLSVGDVRFEPRSALAAGKDGLDDLRQIVSSAPDFLDDGGWLLLEHGHDQAEAVRKLLESRGFLEVTTRDDLAGQARVSGGCWHDH